MIKIKNIEITQEGNTINVDVLDHEGEVEYYFELEAEELEDFLVQYQKENGII